MARETERGGFIKQDTSDSADVAVYNDNLEKIQDEVMSVPFSPSDPPVSETWPGKIILQDSGDPLFFLPDVRFNKADNFWENGTSSSWGPYTPATTNITVGNGTLLGRYMQMGSLLHLEILLIWGSTTAFTGGIGLGAPAGRHWRVPPQNTNGMRSVVGEWMGRVGPSNLLHKGRVLRRNTNVGIDMDCRTNANPSAALTATQPLTWQNGNKLFIHAVGESEWD